MPPIPTNTYTWAGGVAGDWSVPSNWTNSLHLSTYPGEKGTAETDTVVISTANAAVTFDAAATNASILLLQLSNGASLDLGSNTLNITASITYYDTSIAAGSAITVEGGDLNAPGATIRLDPPVAGPPALAGGAISGYGTIHGLFTYGGGAGGGTITAIGGGTPETSTLDVQGTINNGVQLVIGTSTASDLKIDGVSLQNTMSLTNANQTLEIGDTGSLTFYGTTANPGLTTTGGTIQLDGQDSSATPITTATIAMYGGASFIMGGALDGAGLVKGNFSGGGTVDAQYLAATPGNAAYYTLTFSGTVDSHGSTATNFDIDNQATLAFDGAVGYAGGSSHTGAVVPTITFAGVGSGSGLLDLSSESGLFYGNADNFVQGDRIQISTGSTFTVSGSDLLVVNGATPEAAIVLESPADALLADLVISGGNTYIETSAICFMAGTMIRTPGGEVAVETLQRGDLVLTSDGLASPVSWLGRQTISTRFADPLRTWPVRIKAGALAENVPVRDLLLSPDHAVLVDGALIHAGALVNDISIVHETEVPEIFTYYHVELDDHSLVLAENTPAETFVDNVERLAFDNWAEHVALYPEGKSIVELPYPRAKGRRQVPVYIRVQLAERAEIIGASTAAVMVA